MQKKLPAVMDKPGAFTALMSIPYFTGKYYIEHEPDFFLLKPYHFQIFSKIPEMEKQHKQDLLDKIGRVIKPIIENATYPKTTLKIDKHPKNILRHMSIYLNENTKNLDLTKRYCVNLCLFIFRLYTDLNDSLIGEPVDPQSSGQLIELSYFFSEEFSRERLIEEVMRHNGF